MKVLCIEWLFQKNKRIAYVCRNYILAKKIYKDIIQYIPREYVKAANGSDLTIEGINGSTLTFFSSESGASLRGLTFNYLILDEFAFFKMEQTDGTHLWNDILFPTIKVNGKKVLFVSTPLGKDNIFYEMYLRGLSDEFPKYHSIKKTIYDDGLLDEEGIEEIRKQIPELSFKQEFECQFLDSSLTFFQGFEKCFNNISHKYNKSWIGIDLSCNGTDRTVVTKLNELNEVEQFNINGTLDEKYKKIADIINSTKNLQTALVEINGIGSPMLNEIRKLVKDKRKLKEWTTNNSSKERIISNLAVAISNETITFDIENKELYSEFGTFVSNYTKSGHLQLAALNGHHDDYVLSLAIAFESKNSYKPIERNNYQVLENSLSRFTVN